MKWNEIQTHKRNEKFTRWDITMANAHYYVFNRLQEMRHFPFIGIVNIFWATPNPPNTYRACVCVSGCFGSHWLQLLIAQTSLSYHRYRQQFNEPSIHCFPPSSGLPVYLSLSLFTSHSDHHYQSDYSVQVPHLFENQLWRYELVFLLLLLGLV